MSVAGDSRLYLKHALGVLPLLDRAAPARPGLGFVLRLHGRPGDIGILLLSGGRGPLIPLPGFGHAFALDFATTTILSTLVVGRDGFVDLRGPAALWTRLEFQALVLSSTSAYKPGAFSNVLSLDTR